MATRSASHAGSWYSKSASKLNSDLAGWLSAANTQHRPARAIIAPHAGYTYCGACGGHAYKQVDPTNTERVFILGPSHHAYLPGCAVTNCTKYQTPLYDLEVDLKINQELLSTGAFDQMTQRVDEEEHSIEMHLPYIAKVMESKRGKFKIIPVLVGALKADKEEKYGRLFSKYLADPSNLFVISSDFCHWGRRFNYQYYDRSFSKIYESIENLDRQGMDLIEKLDPHGFHAYLGKYENTICGRHPIAVLLHAITALRNEAKNGIKLELKFLKYAQSNQVKSMQDSSVSYGSASLVIS
ncbi:Protein MEMO1 [Holothuria leucospilota]|uniref:Protein MEMO1 n=1 Tax=Holothuria leucospilota TaxID=206669 RepID=A0A9Q1HD82_HOLLE|nr:Protein MEMO1 [Holothuria leucospilota]